MPREKKQCSSPGSRTFKWRGKGLNTQYRQGINWLAVKRRKKTGEPRRGDGPKSYKKEEDRYIIYCAVTLQKCKRVIPVNNRYFIKT
jgi:hypothetical protein